MFPAYGMQCSPFNGQQQNCSPFNGQQQNFPMNGMQCSPFYGQQQNFQMNGMQCSPFYGQQQNFQMNGMQCSQFYGQQQNCSPFNGQQQNFQMNGMQCSQFYGQQQNCSPFYGQQQNFPVYGQQCSPFYGQQQNSNQLYQPQNQQSIELINQQGQGMTPRPQQNIEFSQTVSLPRVTSVTLNNAGYNDDNGSNVVKMPSIWTSKAEQDVYSDNHAQNQRDSRRRYRRSDYGYDEIHYGHSSNLHISRRHFIRLAEEINKEEDHTHQKLLKKREVMEVTKRKGYRKKRVVRETTFYI